MIMCFVGDCPFQCNQCNAKFKINSDLKRHIRVHSGEKPYKCDFCDYRCAMKGNLKSHVQIKHASHNSFRCPDCDFQCANKSALRQHSRGHQPALPMQCPKCSYSCASKGALKIHERVHSDERPFKCQDCSFASKQRSNLHIHRKKCHADKPDKTAADKRTGAGRGVNGETCGEAAPSKPVSSRYRARLEAARAFRCNVCDASFVREDSLRSHRRQHQNLPHSGFLQLPTPTTTASTAAANPSPLAQQPGHASAAIAAPAQEGSLLHPYASTQLKIIVTPQLGPEGSEALLSPVQVSLLPVQSCMQPPVEGALEQQTVLLTHISPEEAAGTPCLPQTLSTDSSQTFITTCSDLDGLTALIQEGGTEVTVVTDAEPSATPSTSSGTPECPLGTPLEVVSQVSPQGDPAKVAEAVILSSESPCEDAGGLMMSNISVGPHGTLLLHNMPLSLGPPERATPLEPLSPHNIFSDTHPGGPDD